MAKGNRNGESQAETTSTESSSVAPVTSETQAAVTPNLVAVFKRNHPQNRCSYGIPGVPGIIVVQRDLVAGTVAVPPTGTELGGMPPSITLGVELVQPKVVNTQAKAEAAAARAKEKADKAAAKVAEQQRKAEEKAAKAKAALEAAQAKAAAAAKPAEQTEEVKA